MFTRLLLILLLMINTTLSDALGAAEKTLIIGSEENFPPFAVGNSDDTAGGYTVDLWKEVAKETGIKYAIRVRPWGQLLHEFRDGKVDVLINMAQSDERHRYADFSVPHVTVHGAIFVRKDERRIKSEADLADKSIIVFKSDLAHEYAVARGWQKQLVVVNTPQEGIRLLASGQYDAMLLSKLAGLQTVRELKITNVKALDTKAGYAQKFSFGVHKGEADLLARLNEGLALTKASGSYDALYNKWFGIYEANSRPTFRDIFPYLAPFLVISLLVAAFNFRKRMLERKRASEALAASEENLRLILDSAGEAIYGIDLNGKCTFCNASCLSMLGYSNPSELIGRNMHDLIHHTYPDGTHYPEDKCRIFKAFKQGSGVLVDDEVLWRQNGTSFPAEYRSYPQFKDGKTIGGVVTFIDMTARRQAEIYREMGQAILLLLNEHENKYEAIQRIIGLVKSTTGLDAIGIRLQDDDDFPYFYQEGFSADFLLKENSLLARMQDGGICRDADGKICLECTCGLVIQGKKDLTSPMWTNGGSCWTNDSFPAIDALAENDARLNPRNECIHQGFASVALIPIRAKGSIVGLLQLNDRQKGRFTTQNIEALEDIADNIGEAMLRKQAEEKLFASERFLRIMTDQLPVMVAYWTSDLRCSFVNKAYMEWFGKKEKDEILGRDLREQLGEELFQKNELYIRRTLQGEPQHFERLLVNSTGEEANTWIHYIPDKVDGIIRGFVALISDVTELKQAEEEKLKLESQLQQAQKMESVGRLAGGVAHDFNNLLTVILGHAELALMQLKPSEPLVADLVEIRQAAERSAALTQQLLAFARKQTIAPRILDLNEVVENILKMLKRLIGEDIRLAWLPGSNLWPVKIDPSQIDQILANLCVNARDAIKDIGKITIETRISTFDDEYCTDHPGYAAGDYVMLAVSDNGCGMDSETISHVFEPFFTTKGLGEGTGLGLATVYGIVKQNSGFINIYSEPGQGTTFRIYFPRYKDADVQPEPGIAATPPSRGQETILLVEDEASILKMTTKLLERQGYDVLAANGPKSALALAAEYTGEIHLLMTDVVMPEMNGRELAHNLAEIRPQIKCLFTSGYTANVIAHHGVLDENINFISKPFSLPALADKLRDILDK